MERSVFSAEKRAGGVGVHLGLGKNLVEPGPEPEKSRLEPAQIPVRDERMVVAVVVFDDVAKLRSRADIGGEKIPLVVELEETQVRLKRDAQRLDRLARIRRGRDHGRECMPPDKYRHSGKDQA